MSNFPIYHGITLAENAYIENLNVEVLAADPVPVGPGRVWFNGTDRVFKFSSLNASGAVIIRTFATAEELAAQLASLTADYQAADAAESAAREAGDAQALSDAKSYSDTKHAEALAYADAVKASLLGGIPPETLDTITELAAALKNNPDIVDVLQSQIIDGIAAAKAELKGTVTTAMDTMGEIETALNAEIAERTSAVNAEQQAREAGDAALDSRLTTVEGQVNGKIGNLSSLHTDEKGSLVGAINEVQDELEAEAARSFAAEAAISVRVAAEESRAVAAETVLQSAIDAEIAARQQAVSDEAATRAAAVTAEENARIDADGPNTATSALLTYNSATTRLRATLLHGAASKLNIDQSLILDEELWDYWLAAEAEAQRKLGLPLQPTQIFTDEPTEAEKTALGSMPYIVEPGYDLPPDFFSTQVWGTLKLRVCPVISVESIRLIYPSMSHTIFEVPSNWVKLDGKYGQVQITPGLGSINTPLAMVSVQAVTAGVRVPHMIRVKYKAGINGKSPEFADLVDLVKQMALLRILQGAFVPGSSSISADGLSQSISLDIDKHQDAVDQRLEQIRGRILGPIWGVL